VLHCLAPSLRGQCAFRPTRAHRHARPGRQVRINHRPERASRQGSNAQRWAQSKTDTLGLSQDRRVRKGNRAASSHPAKLPVIWSCLPSRHENESIQRIFSGRPFAERRRRREESRFSAMGQVVIQRKLLRHHIRSLPHVSGSKTAALTRKLHFPLWWAEQPAEAF